MCSVEDNATAATAGEAVAQREDVAEAVSEAVRYLEEDEEAEVAAQMPFTTVQGGAQAQA